MPDTPTRGSIAETAKTLKLGKSTIYKYIAGTRGDSPDPLDLQSTPFGYTLDVEKTRAYAATRRNGRPPKWSEQSA